MKRVTFLLFVVSAVVNAQKLPLNPFSKDFAKTEVCTYKYDQNSPFFWKGEQDLCTQELCDQYPELKCYVDPIEIERNVLQHPDPTVNITQEVRFLQRYFDTHIPKPSFRTKNYQCLGVCERHPQPLERLFADFDFNDYYTGTTYKKRVLCHVYGPKIYRKSCGGPCRILMGGKGSYCVPDVTVSMDVWVYCPNIEPGCRKIRVDLPLSCSCKKIDCWAPPPEVGPIKPRLPDFGSQLDDLFGGPSTDSAFPTDPTPAGQFDPTGLQGLPPAVHGPIPDGIPQGVVAKPQDIPVWK